MNEPINLQSAREQKEPHRGWSEEDRKTHLGGLAVYELEYIQAVSNAKAAFLEAKSEIDGNPARRKDAEGYRASAENAGIELRRLALLQ